MTATISNESFWSVIFGTKTQQAVADMLGIDKRRLSEKMKAKMLEELKSLKQERDELLQSVQALTIERDNALQSTAETATELTKGMSKAADYVQDVAMENRHLTARLEICGEIPKEEWSVLTEYVLDEIKTMLADGQPLERIASNVGIAKDTVQHIRNGNSDVCPGRENCPFAKMPGRKAKITPEVEKKIMQLHNAGMSVRKIASEVGLTSTPVHKTIKANVPTVIEPVTMPGQPTEDDTDTETQQKSLDECKNHQDLIIYAAQNDKPRTWAFGQAKKKGFEISLSFAEQDEIWQSHRR